MNINTIGAMTVLGILAAIAVTVLAYIFIIPEKKREGLPKIFKFIHDLFNFKELYLEKILKALYILCTVACVTIGLFWQMGFSVYEGYYDTYVEWYGGYGLLMILVGPIVIRIVYESLMMFVLLVKNTIEINNKLKAPHAEEVPHEEEVPAVQETTEA